MADNLGSGDRGDMSVDRHDATIASHIDVGGTVAVASTAATLDAVFSSLARSIENDLGRALSSADPSGTHKLRVSLRRLRAALAAFKPVIRRKIRKRLARSARWLGRVLSPLRDADAAIEDVVSGVADVDDDMLAALRDWRERVRAKVRAHLISSNASQLHIDLSQLAEDGSWRRRSRKAEARCGASSDVLLAPALNQAWRRVDARGKRLQKLDKSECHSMRKDLKTLRYLSEIAVTEEIAPRLPLLRKLQVRLGRVSDLDALGRLDPLADHHLRKKFRALCRRLAAEDYRKRAMRKANATYRTLAKEWVQIGAGASG